MRIIHVIASTDPQTGGPIEVVNTLSDVWERHGHTSHVVSLDKPEADWLGRAGSRVTALGIPGTLVSRLPARGYSFSPWLAPWLRRHASDYDAAIVHGLWNYASYGGWLGLRRSSVPYYVFTHGMLDPWFTRARPNRAKLKSLFWKLFEHRVLSDAAGVLFTTEEERRGAAQSFEPYRVRELVVGLGARDIVVDRDRGQNAFLAKVPGVDGRRFALFLGRIHPKKGIDLLLRAFAAHAARHPDLDLVVAGPDHVGLRPKLEALSAQLSLQGRVHWPGMLEGDAKFGAFQKASFFVLPSHQENFGIAVAEALACRTPVLITNKVNIWPQIADREAGLVVNDDVAGISDGFARLAQMGLEERQAMGANARQCFEDNFELERVSMSLLDVITRKHEPAAARRPTALVQP